MKISDFHNDALTSKIFEFTKLSSETNQCVCAVYTGNRTFEKVRSLVNIFEKQKKENLFLSLEDASYLDEDNIEEVCSWKPVCISLTWNEGNALAGGCLSGEGLSAQGKKLVQILARHKIPIDCAHLNERSFYEIAEATPYIVNSHSCFYDLCQHPRNIKDRQAQLLCERNGLLGITFVGKFLNHEKSFPHDVFRHIDHGVQKFGTDSLCIGTDFFGTDDLPCRLTKYNDIGMEDLFTCFVKAGYKLKDIHKIFVGNLNKFLNKI